MNENKYMSRKFIVTVAGMLGAVACAYAGILTPELSNIILAGIASYNVVNGWVSKTDDK